MRLSNFTPGGRWCRNGLCAAVAVLLAATQARAGDLAAVAVVEIPQRVVIVPQVAPLVYWRISDADLVAERVLERLAGRERQPRGSTPAEDGAGAAQAATPPATDHANTQQPDAQHPAPDDSSHVGLTAGEVVAHKCAACHAGEDARGGLVLVKRDGRAVDLSGLDRRTRRTIFERLLSADPELRMPKQGELDDEQFRALYEALFQ